MQRDEAIENLRNLMPELRKFGVKSLSLFGSVARDDATDRSDLDLLVEFEGERTSDGFFGTLFLLEDRLGIEVNLAQPDTLHQLLREKILSEAFVVA